MRKLLVALVVVAFLAPAAWGHGFPPPEMLEWEGDGIDIHHPDGDDPIYRPGKEGPPVACPQYIIWRQIDGDWFGIPAFVEWLTTKFADDDQWEGERLE